MKKKCISILIIFFLLLIASQILVGSESILKSVVFSFSIWQNNIFPSLFPFFVLSEILIHYGFVEFLTEICKPLMVKIFKINPKTAFIFVMSIISGFPSSAKYTRELYLKGDINKQEAEKILMFTHFSNPLFILGTVAITFLDNKEAGLLILIIHYLVNFFIGFLFRNFSKTTEKTSKIHLSKAINDMHEHRISNSVSFGKMISDAILNSIHTLFLILGTVTMFLIFTTILDNNLNISSYAQSLVNGFVEMTQGLKYVSLLSVPLKFKSIMTVMILSFGGLSVHMQVASILSDTEIRYLPFLTARLLHAAFAGILVFLSFEAWINLF